MMTDMGPVSIPFDADDLKACPFCGVKMHRFAEHPSFFHPGAVTDKGCVLSGRGFCDDEARSWNTRAALSQPTDEAAVVRVARALYECERQRGERADAVVRSAFPAASSLAIEPWEECKDAFLSDARAALAAMPAPAEE